MKNAIEIRNLRKNYPSFSLKDISLTLPSGCIMGFIGENGAGKSTTIKALLGLIKIDGGQLHLLGQKAVRENRKLYNDVGFVLDNFTFPEGMTALQVGTMLGGIYKGWDNSLYRKNLQNFSLDPKKKIKEYSRGMNMKLSIAAAISHGAKLLILDEPTSGLDPIIRDEILEILRDFIQDEQHAVFLSSHITSDLEKICDYITFIHNGKLLLSEEKDTLLGTYGILKCGKRDFDAIDPRFIHSYRKNDFGAEALVKRKFMPDRHIIDPASLDDIMLFMVKGQKFPQ